MITITIMSTHPGTGQTTIAVNAATGLCNLGYRVLLDTCNNNTIKSWLSSSNLDVPNLDLVINGEPNSAQQYDFYLLNIDCNGDRFEHAINQSQIIALCTDLSTGEPEALANLNKRIEQASKFSQKINLIIPNKINTKEWDQNTEQLFLLTEEFSAEKIADFIPSCEAIHDLSRTGLTVWDLPEKYQNRKNAFNRLIDTILNIEKYD